MKSLREAEKEISVRAEVEVLVAEAGVRLLHPTIAADALVEPSAV